MFKNAIIYKIVTPRDFNIVELEDAAASQAFAPTGPTQESSIGWVPPRGEESGALVESISGELIMKLMIETRSVPAQAIKDKVEEEVRNIESTTGRKPGKKEIRDLKADARLALLPNAFKKKTSINVWIDRQTGMLLLDASSQSKADMAATVIVKTIEGIALQLISTSKSPQTAMAQWLVEHEGPENFSIDRSCVLKACDESKAVVRYTRHALDTEEISQHIALGKMPTQLAITWNDRISMVLTENMQLRKLGFLDVVFESQAGKESEGDDFDSDVAISTGELKKMLPDMLNALGGVTSIE